jgi:hypothetical protein
MIQGGTGKMEPKKYGKYLIKAPIEKWHYGENVIRMSGDKNFGGVNVSFAWGGIPGNSEPYHMIKDAHKHDFDQFLCFIGGDLMNIREFGAEIELSLGEEKEKHIIDYTSLIYIPKGLTHCPLNIKRVDKTIVMMDIYFSPNYVRSSINNLTPDNKNIVGTKYDKYIIKEPIAKGRSATSLRFYGRKLNGYPFSVIRSCMAKPYDMREDVHAHDYDQFLCFMGGNPMDVKEFNAEVELSLGEEREKQIINSPTIAYIPKGLMHCPLNFKRVDKPIAFMNIFLTPTYTMSVKED